MKKNILRKLFVFILIFTWLFTGWPVIWQDPRIPPKTQVAYALTSGPRNPGTSAGVGVVGGCTNAENWLNDTTPGNVSSNDNSYISMTGTKYDNTEKTDELRLSNFGFSISGTVTGITVETLGWAPAGAANYTTVQLFTSPGTKVGTDKATGALPTSDPGANYTTWGGTADTWSAGLTAAQVSSSNFGIVLCFTATANDTNINIDHVRITITYTNSASMLSVSTPPEGGATVVVGQSYDITYTLTDTEDEATVDFYWDDGLDFTGTAITGCQDQTKGTGAICAWDTTSMTAGDYYVYGIATDGVNDPVSDYSPGMITIQTAVYSVSITPEGTIEYGLVGKGESKSTLQFEPAETRTAQNDGNTAEKLSIATTNASGGTGWTIGLSAGVNIFVHEFSTNGGSGWTTFTAADNYQTLVGSLGVGNTQPFDLRITVPTDSDAIQKSITVTILAEQL